MQTKIAIIVSIRYVFWAAGMPKMLSRSGFLSRPCLQSLQRSPSLLSCCFFAIFKHCWLTTGSWKNASGVLESSGKVWNFFVSKRVGTL